MQFSLTKEAKFIYIKIQGNFINLFSAPPSSMEIAVVIFCQNAHPVNLNSCKNPCHLTQSWNPCPFRGFPSAEVMGLMFVGHRWLYALMVMENVEWPHTN